MFERIAAIILVLFSTLWAPAGSAVRAGCGSSCGEAPAASCCSERDDACPCCESVPVEPVRRELPNVPSPREGLAKLVMVLPPLEGLVSLPRPEMREVPGTAAMLPRSSCVRVQAALCVWRT